MATIAEIRDGIKTTLSGISGLRVYDTVPDVAHVPAAVVVPESGDFNVAMGRGTDTHTFSVFVLCSRSVPRVGQDSLDSYLTGAGASSIRQAVFNASTLGLANTTANVAGYSEYGATFESAGVDHIGAVLQVVVHTKGTS